MCLTDCSKYSWGSKFCCPVLIDTHVVWVMRPDLGPWCVKEKRTECIKISLRSKISSHSALVFCIERILDFRNNWVLISGIRRIWEMTVTQVTRQWSRRYEQEARGGCQGFWWPRGRRVHSIPYLPRAFTLTHFFCSHFLAWTARSRCETRIWVLVAYLE